jgi:hypothetical protein
MSNNINSNSGTLKSNTNYQYDSSSGLMNSFYLSQLNNNLNGIFGANNTENTNFSRGIIQQPPPQQQQQQHHNQYPMSKINVNQNDIQNQLITVLSNNQSKNPNNYQLSGSMDENNLKQQHLTSNEQQQQQQTTMFNDIGLLNMASVINLSTYLNSNNSSSSPSSSSSSASSTSSGTLLNSNSISSLNSNTNNNGFNSSYNNLFSQQQQQQNWLLNNSINNTNNNNGNINGKQCTSCQEKPDSTCYCHDCKERLCHNCFLAHQRVRLTKDHRIHFYSVLDNGTNSAATLESLLNLNGNASNNNNMQHGHHQQMNSSASTPPSSSSSTNGSSSNGNKDHHNLSMGNVNRFMLPLSNSPDLLLSSSVRSNPSGLMSGINSELDINIMSSQNGVNLNNGSSTGLISPHSHLINSSQAIIPSNLNGQSNSSFIGANSLFGSNSDSDLINGCAPQIGGNQNALALQVS